MDISGATNFGIINAMRTGNIIFDVCISIFIPMVITAAMSKSVFLTEKIKKVYQKCINRTEFYRIIEYNRRFNGYGEQHGSDDDGTDLLHKGITLYINHTYPATYTHGGFKFIDPDGDNFHDPEEGEEEEEDCYSDNSTVKTLREYRMVTHPDSDEWVQLTPTLKFQRIYSETDEETQSTKQNRDKENRTIKTSIELCSSAKDGKREIDTFVTNAMKWYEKYIISRHKEHRYMYMLDNALNEDKILMFKRYALSNNKTFDTTFIPNKNFIISLIDDFQSQKGKFAIAGFPKQLSLLLTGPPGTGKTSLIKAISHYTNRHVIDIPLSKIDTNQKLYDIMFGKKYRMNNQTDIRSFRKTIYVIEDIDCVSDIVFKRKKESEKKITKIDLEDIVDSDDGKKKMKEGPSFKRTLNTDPLTLSGILNVIDGVIDCPQRMLIITTNHPAKLDPALIRPGRINIRVHLGYAKPKETIEMVKNYVSDIDEGNITCIKNLMKGDHTITTAIVEKLCIEYNTIEEIISGIRKELL
jgi:ATP-dependent 26S proteasome regulatory subunit